MMEHINAPYNFVPLSSTVVTPQWGRLVSHDLPFKDGVSGELELTIEAQTDILVGGRQEGNHVHFFQMEGGRGQYAIPGSSLRGMIRNVMEIATFSRMNNVDDKSYGLRDLSSNRHTNYTSPYMLHMQKHRPQSGFLRMVDSKVIIVPCEMARLDHRDLEKWLNQKKPVFNSRKSDAGGHKRVKDKYNRWEKISKGYTEADGKIRCSIETVDNGFTEEKRAENLGNGNVLATPVFTGQISDCTQGKTEKDRAKKKHKDFVFYDLHEENAIDVQVFDGKAWGDFLFIHHDSEDSENSDMSWPNYWRSQFRSGRDVPVFYLKDDDRNRLQIGLAYLPKLAGDFSVYDMIRHTSKEHLAENDHDFTSLVFGRVGKEPDDALKGRVFFEPAVLQGNEQPDQNPPATILNGAKPSYFPNYVKQPTDNSGTKLLSNTDYATYLKTDENPKPKVRGWKRYPAKSDYKPDKPPSDASEKVTTHLHVLPKGATFKSRLVFHNLKPEELGALLWSIQLEEGHNHAIGMGKSFGAGQVRVSVNWKDDYIACNDSSQQPEEPIVYIQQFQKYLRDKWLKAEWGDSEQITALLSMTKPEGLSERFSGKLKHMKIDNGARNSKDKNDFVNAKQNRLVLGSFKPVKATAGRNICPWVDDTIATLAKQHRVPEGKLDQVLYGKPLADAWQAIDDADLKQAALEDIQARWDEDVWNSPPKGARRKARAVYEAER